jgi:hypothetical protein
VLGDYSLIRGFLVVCPPELSLERSGVADFDGGEVILDLYYRNVV